MIFFGDKGAQHDAGFFQRGHTGLLYGNRYGLRFYDVRALRT